MTDKTRYAILAVVLILIGGAIYYLDDSMTGVANLAEIDPASASVTKDMQFPRAKEIVAPAGFVNTAGNPVTIREFIGKKVILVDFLTYSCINCVRVQPYLNAWHEKYKDKGLQIIGVHTPEFEFEEDITNVSRAMRDMGVKYPIVLDNDYGTWRAYQNSYWPRKYLIDIDGYIVYDHIGEGGYAETERKIQELLHERMARLGEQNGIASDITSPEGVEEAVTDRLPRTPEIYLGSLRNARHLANPRPGAGQQQFIAPEKLETHALYLDGLWSIAPEYARGVEGSRIMLKFQAKKVFMVARSEKGTILEVRIDGEDIKTMHIQADDLYRLIENDDWGEHTLELIVRDGELDAFTFTFG